MRTSRTIVRSVALVAIASLGLTACGGETDSSGSAGTDVSSSVTITKDEALAAAVPAKVKQAGYFAVGVDPTYAPNEMLAADGKTVEGTDVDILDAVAAKLGVKT